MADDRDAAMFKEVSGGYVFRAQNPWVFGRAKHYLVNDSQKAQLTAAAVRSPFLFWIALVGLIGAFTAMLSWISGHDDPTVGDAVILLALIPLAIYGALVLSIYSSSRRLGPLLVDLPLTDQRITVAELREVALKASSLPQFLILAASQAVLSAVFLLLAVQNADGNIASVFNGGTSLVYAVAGVISALSAVSLLLVALNKFKNRQKQALPSTASFGKTLLAAICLGVSVASLGLVIKTGERSRETAVIQNRLQSLRERTDKAQIPSRQASLKARTAANSARMSTLIAKLNALAIICETVAAPDGQSRPEEALCRAQALKEKENTEQEILATRKESEALRQENAAIEQEIVSIRMEIDSIQSELKANR
jgi:hypothetical protein